MLLKNMNRLLESRYLPLETGYCKLPNGQYYFAVLTRMPGCKVRWLKWWFSVGGAKKNTTVSSPVTQKCVQKLKKDIYLHQGKYLMDHKKMGTRLRPADPTKYFDVTRLKNSEFTIIACSDIVLPDDTVKGHVIQLARNTDYGCELKTCFWLNNVTESIVRLRLEHYFADIGNLADFLKILIKNIKQESNKPDICCKYCYDDDVVKNGKRKSGQYWRCNTCGHCFINNGALPKMKYPLELIVKAANEHLHGESLGRIQKNITTDLNYLPSTSSLHGWIKKLADIALEI